MLYKRWCTSNMSNKTRGIYQIMFDLGVSSFEELAEYINDPSHTEESLVIELKETLAALEKGDDK